MLTLFSKVQKIQRQQALKIDVFDYPTVVWRPSPRNPHEYPYKLTLLETRVTGLHRRDSVGLSAFKFFCRYEDISLVWVVSECRW